MRLRAAPTIAIIVAASVLASLGVWQLQRLTWKEGVIASIQAGLAAAPININTDALPPSPAAIEFRRMSATGVFDHTHELHFPARTYQGKVGLHIVTPLVLEGNRALMVNRGWVENGKLAEASRPTGPITVQGIARWPQPPRWLQLPNNAADNQWYRYDLPAMSAATGRAALVPFVLEAEAGGAETFPLGGVTIIDIPNNHRQYALFWFSAALIVLLLGLYAGHRQSPTKGQNKP